MMCCPLSPTLIGLLSCQFRYKPASFDIHSVASLVMVLSISEKMASYLRAFAHATPLPWIVLSRLLAPLSLNCILREAFLTV